MRSTVSSAFRPSPADTFSLAGARLALLTRHGKERVLGPILEPALGVHLVHVDSIDTDTLGTFTREVPRQGSQHEAALRKARLAGDLAACRFAVASEGAFVSDPWTGLLPWNIEMVLLIDLQTGVNIVGTAQGATLNRQQCVRDREGLQAVVENAGFPGHALVMRPDTPDDPRIIKGIDSPLALIQAFEETLALSASGQVFVEHDLRAHCHPGRRLNIASAAQNLVDRLQSRCPECRQPDFWRVDVIAGLPCRWCGEPTAQPKAERWQCPACEHTEIRPREAYADPSRCEHCNP